MAVRVVVEDDEAGALRDGGDQEIRAEGCANPGLSTSQPVGAVVSVACHVLCGDTWNQNPAPPDAQRHPALQHPIRRGPFVALIGESQHDPALAAALRQRFVASRRAAAKEVLARGIERGELRADLDLDLAIDALYGALYYRLLVSGDKLTPRYADALLDQFYPALAPG